MKNGLKKLLPVLLIILLALAFAACGNDETEEAPTQTADAHVHTFGEWTAVLDPTCDVDGLKERTCSDCGEKESLRLPASGHTVVIDPGKDRSCTEDGATEGAHCSVCKKVLIASNVLPAQHTFGEWEVITPVTCTTDGSRKHTCTVCTTTVTEVVPAGGHQFGEWTVKTAAGCETPGSRVRTCDVCKQEETEEIRATGHKYGDPIIVLRNTCETDGITKEVCATCNHEKTDVIPHVGHNPVKDPAKAPNCSEYGLTEGSHCSVCGQILVAQNKLEKADHVFDIGTIKKHATCTETGVMVDLCLICGETRENIIPCKSHEYSDQWTVKTPATATEHGVEERLCNGCNGAAEERPIHNWTETSRIEPKHESGIHENGSVVYTCSVCGETKTEVLPVEHTFGDIDAEATQGHQTKTCTTCGFVQIQTKLIKGGEHSWGEYEVSVAATCFENGKSVRICTVCGTTNSKTIKAPGHQAFLDAEGNPVWFWDQEQTCNQDGHRHSTCSVCHERFDDVQKATGKHQWKDGFCETCGVIRASQGFEFSTPVGGKVHLVSVGKCDDVEINIPERDSKGNLIIAIDSYAFAGCVNVTSVLIPTSIQTIGAGAFSGCTGLNRITFYGNANSLTEIGEGAFSNCNRLPSVSIPASVKTIGNSAFQNCRAMEWIDLPASVTTIGSHAFDYCPSFSTVYYRGTAEQFGSIQVGAHNMNYFTGAEVLFYSEATPTGEGKYWHFVDAVPTAW